MFLLDNLIGFVLDKIAAVADQELNNEEALRERLLEAQMRFELGEIGEAKLAAVEREILGRLREIKARQQGETADGERKITGVEVSIKDDEP